MRTCADTTCPCDMPQGRPECVSDRAWCYPSTPCMDCRVPPRLVLVPDLKEQQ